MKCGILIFLVVCTAASVAEDFLKSRPLATLVPEYQFTKESVAEMAFTVERRKKTTKRHTTTTKKTTIITTEKTVTTAVTPTDCPKTTKTTQKPTTRHPKPTKTTPEPTTTTPEPTTTTPEPTTTTPEPTTTTPEPTTTTPEPTTTTPEPTTTTPEPTTTTPEPTTTTPEPTTTSGPPTTTTAQPNATTANMTTTSTAKPPAPPKPTNPTELRVGKYTFKTKNGSICGLAEMALQIRLESAKDNGTFIVQPNQTTGIGTCKEDSARLNITFPQGSILFTFKKNSTENTAHVDTLSFNLYYPLSTQAAEFSQRNDSLDLFMAKVGHCYSCRNDSVYMGNRLHLDVTQTRMQAFNLIPSHEFGPSDPCAADAGGYGVAIAVGVILVVLIVIVIVAYLLGSRRRANGYQSL